MTHIKAHLITKSFVILVLIVGQALHLKYLTPFIKWQLINFKHHKLTHQ